MCSQYQAVEIATLLPGSHIKEIMDSDRIVYVGAMTGEKKPGSPVFKQGVIGL